MIVEMLKKRYAAVLLVIAVAAVWWQLSSRDATIAALQKKVDDADVAGLHLKQAELNHSVSVLQSGVVEDRRELADVRRSRESAGRDVVAAVAAGRKLEATGSSGDVAASLAAHGLASARAARRPR